MISLAEHVTATDTEDGLVLLDERAGRYWQVNTTAAAVLDHVLAGGSPESAAALLRARHPDARDRADDDVRGLLAALRLAKLVTP